jgi:hypothetical protein
MEDVIVGLLFVYFFVIRPILKQARKGRSRRAGVEQPGGAKPRGSLTQLLAKVRDKLREAAEQAEAAKRAPGRPGGQAPWEALFSLPAAEPAPEPWDGDGDTEGVAAWGEAEATWERAPTQPEPAAPPPPQTVSVSAPSAPEPPPWRGVSVTELRRAVIWSEILAPPVSLREG